MRLKRRNVLIILGLLALAVVCFAMLRPLHEPKYQGRYLSEWLAISATEGFSKLSPKGVEAQEAVRSIGTNALPHFLKWMRYELPPWRVSLRRKLPLWIADNRMVRSWIYRDALLRPHYGFAGLGILGTNAIPAMPELEGMMKDRTKRECARLARMALSDLGEPAIPILQAALADPHQADRDKILEEIGLISTRIGTNKCLPILVAALTHEDALVREKATNYVSAIAPRFLTNTPSQ